MFRPTLEPIEPTNQDAQRAAKASRSLANGQLDVAELPEIVIQMISVILDQTARGHALTVVPFETDMTTTAAAEYLNVSRPYLVKLLGEGKLPFHYVGAHRRISFKELKTYKEQQKAQSYAALTELQAQAQELNMGY